MKIQTRHLASLVPTLAIALLAFGSQIAFADEAPAVSREQVRAEALRAQRSGALERQRITSYSPNADWGPGAPANTSARARKASAASVDTASGADNAAAPSPSTSATNSRTAL